MKLSKIYEKLDNAFPFIEQVDSDNAGFLIGSFDKDVQNVLLTLDITKDVIEEAKENSIDLIIAHHPIIFTPMKQINYDTYYGHMVKELIINDIAVIAAHTNYDVNPEGMNVQLMSLFGATNIRKHQEDPFIVMGDVNTTIDEFIKLVVNSTNRNQIRYVGPSSLQLNKIAVIGGSGGYIEAIDLMKNSNVDLFITGDVSSSKARYAKEIGVNILDVSHNIEDIFKTHMREFLKNEDLVLKISKIDTDPFTFL